MAKQIFLYKLAKDLAEQLNQEEDLEQEYDDNEQNVTIDNDDEDDGTAVLDEYDEKLAQFTMMQNDDRNYYSLRSTVSCQTFTNGSLETQEYCRD